MHVRFSPRARTELSNALAYHGEPNEAADRFSIAVERVLERMSSFPRSARQRPDFTMRDVRFWLVASFWLVTQEFSDYLLVVTVVHVARNLRAHMRGVSQEFR